jgi:hypothetical protein
MVSRHTKLILVLLHALSGKRPSTTVKIKLSIYEFMGDKNAADKVVINLNGVDSRFAYRRFLMRAPKCRVHEPAVVFPAWSSLLA